MNGISIVGNGFWNEHCRSVLLSKGGISILCAGGDDDRLAFLSECVGEKGGKYMITEIDDSFPVKFSFVVLDTITRQAKTVVGILAVHVDFSMKSMSFITYVDVDGIFQRELKKYEQIIFGNTPYEDDDPDNYLTLSEWRDSCVFESTLDMPLTDFGLSVRTQSVLNVNNILTIRDLVRYTPEQIINLENFGRKGYNEVKEIIENLDLAFASDK